MLKAITPLQTAWLIFAITLATISGAWIFEYAGYPPCELCLAQRWAYYVAVPLSFVVAVIGLNNPAVLRGGLVLLGLIMLGSCAFGIFHAGVEWKLWQGPTACTGGSFTSILPDLNKKAVMCDQPSLYVFGLSLAVWNAIISAATSMLAFRKTSLAYYGSSSVSQ